MTRQQVTYLVVGGLILAVVGLIVMQFMGGWSATGIGTAHSGSTGGVFAAILLFGGLIVAFVGGLGAVIGGVASRMR